MENKELLALLNDLYEKEQSLRDLKKSVDSQGHTLISGPDLLKDEYNIVVGLLIILYYKRILFIQEGWCIEDVERCIKNSTIPYKEDLLEIWSVYKNQYPYTEKFGELLCNYDFSGFVNTDEDTLLKWVNQKYLFGGSFLSFYDGLNDFTSFEIISRCEKQLGIELNKGNILLNVYDDGTIQNILTSHSKDCNYVLYGLREQLKIAVLINCALFESCSNITIMDKESEESIIPSSGSYDGIVIMGTKETISLDKTAFLDIVTDGGFAILSNYDNDIYIDQKFFDYEVPLMFDYGESSLLLIKKTKDETSTVRFASFYVNEYSFGESDYLIDKLTERIKNGIISSDYQELKKEDFSINRSLKFNDVKRLPDQLNFVWRKKEDIYSIVEDNEEWLDNANVDDSQIIKAQNLSMDPFKIAAGAQYYLHNFVNKDGDEPHPLSECTFERGNSYDYKYSIPRKYAGIFLHLYDYGGKVESDDDKMADKYFCCRLLKSPCLLYHNGGGILRVNASETDPVCMRKYSIFYFEDEGKIDCQAQCDVIKINPEYDENFIIYQLLKQKDPLNTHYILVAPTKEEQHTYFLNKRLDYISKFQPVVDEMEDEVSRSISESPARITGVGFHNFRRFSSLPILPFSGVNILVGGNNAGKSSLVKGMLLAIDNIKSYIVDNNDNSIISPIFNFDTRNYHEVRVGTFDRSYSYNAIPWKNEPDRRTMSFTLSCAHFIIELNIEPLSNQSDLTSVPVASIMVRDTKRNAEFFFDFKNMSTAAVFLIEGERVEYKYPGFNIGRPKLGDNQIPVLIRGIVPTGKTTFLQDKELSEKLKAKAGFILEIADELERVIKNINVEYIYAHGVSQKVLFNINDKNDYMAQTLHDFIVEKTGDVENEFIKKCLNDFGLGTDFDVHSIGGEAYIIQIKNNNGKMVYLADLGMGTNQLVILIFRLAIIIHKQRMRGTTPYRPTIIIEEPEQNMHPAFQSKLATLFYEVNRDYGFSFIVETHSEYLVRKTQVFVLQQKFADDDELKKNNPFMVYYFPSDGYPYEMMYSTKGKFLNKFKPGFYDEAGKLALELL